MNWYLQRGKDSDVVVNCKIMYSRNLRNHRFNPKNVTEIQEIENEVKSKLQGLGYNLKFIKIKDLDELTKMSMLEKGLIDETAIKNENISALINNISPYCCRWLHRSKKIWQKYSSNKGNGVAKSSV